MEKYRSERIVNISELDAILEKISILSQLAENSSDIDEIKGFVQAIGDKARKARDFEFRIEVRTIHEINIGRIAPEDIERTVQNEETQ